MAAGTYRFAVGGSMTLMKAMSRTLLLMRDEVHESVTDETLLEALTGTRVALIADEANIASHSAQTTFVTTALLAARSAHHVTLICPDLPMIGHQLPLAHGRLITELVRAGGDLLPGQEFARQLLPDGVDIAIALGNSEFVGLANRCVRLNASAWSGRIAPESEASLWEGGAWPLGAMAAAALAATEVFKIAVRKLEPVARNSERMKTVFADTERLAFELAPPATPLMSNLGSFDCISGGAITNAVLYALVRVPGVFGQGRIIEPEQGDLTNLNRYMLLLRSRIDLLKADDLALQCEQAGIAMNALPHRYERRHRDTLILADSVLVGVDDIPTRWEVQRARPEFLAIGATTHWSAMASYHEDDLGCAECLHPIDDENDAPIPTVAFVSFWAGLLTATKFLMHRAGMLRLAQVQQIYLTAFRAENAVSSTVPKRVGCPSCGLKESVGIPLVSVAANAAPASTAT